MSKKKSLPDEGSAGEKNKQKASEHATQEGAAKLITPPPTNKRRSNRIAKKILLPFIILRWVSYGMCRSLLKLANKLTREAPQRTKAK